MDLRDQLQKTLGDACTLERELGGGGMSRSAARRGTVTYLATPDFDPLRGHRRYPELLRALGLHDQSIAQWKGRAPAAP